jgi:hypothetical protein
VGEHEGGRTDAQQGESEIVEKFAVHGVQVT